MAKIIQTPTVNLSLTFTINESEARALDALAGYDSDKVLQVFKDHLGSHYIKGHEQGLKTFLEDIRGFIPGVLAKLDDARKTFNEQKSTVLPVCIPTTNQISQYNDFWVKKSKTY